MKPINLPANTLQSEKKASSTLSAYRICSREPPPLNLWAALFSKKHPWVCGTSYVSSGYARTRSWVQAAPVLVSARGSTI